MKAQKISKSECKPQSNNVCCICAGTIKKDKVTGWAQGHNAYPYGTATSNRCCDECNWNIVIPTRIGMSYLKLL